MKYLLKILVIIIALGLFIASFGQGRASVGQIFGVNERGNNWGAYYDPEHAYFNDGYELINVREEPGTDADVVSYIKPLEGGFIQTCDEAHEWCFVDFGGEPHAGWVKMSALEESRLAYGQ